MIYTRGWTVHFQLPIRYIHGTRTWSSKCLSKFLIIWKQSCCPYEILHDLGYLNGSYDNIILKKMSAFRQMFVSSAAMSLKFYDLPLPKCWILQCQTLNLQPRKLITIDYKISIYVFSPNPWYWIQKLCETTYKRLAIKKHFTRIISYMKWFGPITHTYMVHLGWCIASLRTKAPTLWPIWPHITPIRIFDLWDNTLFIYQTI